MIDWETRAQWGAKPPRYRRTDVAPKGIAIHWPGPGSFVGQSHARCREVMRAWQQQHMANNSNDIEYGLILCPHLTLMEGRIEQDRPNVRVGSNGTREANYRFSSIQLMRGSGDGPPTDAEVHALAEAVAWLRKANGWQPIVGGHRDHVPTTCPGDALYRRLPEISRLADQIAEGDDDMPISKDDAEMIWSAKVFPNPDGEPDKWAARGYVSGMWKMAQQQNALLEQILAELKAARE